MNITINSQAIPDYMQIVKLQLISLAFMALSGAAAVESHEEEHARKPCASSKCKYLLNSDEVSATNAGDNVSAEAPALDNEEKKHTEECCVKKGGCRCRDAKDECAERCGQEDGENACKDKGIECPEDCGKGVMTSACNNKGMENSPSSNPGSVQQVSRAPEPVPEGTNTDSRMEEKKETSSGAREDRIIGKEEEGDSDSGKCMEYVRLSIEKELSNLRASYEKDMSEVFIRFEKELASGHVYKPRRVYSDAEKERKEKKDSTPKQQKLGSSDVDDKKQGEGALSAPQHAPGIHVHDDAAVIRKGQSVSSFSGDAGEENASDPNYGSEEEDYRDSDSESCEEGESKEETVVSKMLQTVFGSKYMQLKEQLTEQDKPNGFFSIDGYLLEGERSVVTGFAVKTMLSGKTFLQNSG